MNPETEKTVGTNLTVISEYTESAVALADMESRLAGLVFDVKTPKGMAEAKKARAEPRDHRIALEKKRVEIKAPALERCRLIDSEATRIRSRLLVLEENADIPIKTEEARAEAEKLAKIQAEQERQDAIAAKIDVIRNVPAGLIGKPSVIIAGQLAKLEAEQLDEDEFAEHFIAARDVLELAVARVKQMHIDQVAQEAEQKKIAADRAELARIRAENERLQKAAEERAAADRAEADRKAREGREREAAYIQRIRDQITELSFVAPIANWGSEQIDGYIAERNKLDPRDADNDFDFAEWQGEACDAFDKAISHLHEIRRTAIQREHEEFERSERQRLEAIERGKQMEAAAAERAAVEAEQKAERVRLDAQQALLAKEASALMKEKASAAKKAEADRLANLGLHEAAQAAVAWFVDEGHDDEQVCTDLRFALSNEAKPARAKKVAA